MCEPDLPPEIAVVVKSFCSSPEGIAGREAATGPTACESTSHALLREMLRAGLVARMLELRGWKGPRGGLHADHRDTASEHLFHYVVECEGWTIDFTRRQFEPQAACPTVLRFEPLMERWAEQEPLEANGEGWKWRRWEPLIL